MPNLGRGAADTARSGTSSALASTRVEEGFARLGLRAENEMAAWPRTSLPRRASRICIVEVLTSALVEVRAFWPELKDDFTALYPLPVSTTVTGNFIFWCPRIHWIGFKSARAAPGEPITTTSNSRDELPRRNSAPGLEQLTGSVDSTVSTTLLSRALTARIVLGLNSKTCSTTMQPEVASGQSTCFGWWWTSMFTVTSHKAHFDAGSGSSSAARRAPRHAARHHRARRSPRRRAEGGSPACLKVRTSRSRVTGRLEHAHVKLCITHTSLGSAGSAGRATSAASRRARHLSGSRGRVHGRIYDGGATPFSQHS